MSSPLPASVAHVLRRELDVLRAKREETCRVLDRQIADLEFVLQGGGADTPPTPDVKPAVVLAAAEFNTRSIRAATDALIDAGVRATTSAVCQSLVQAGIQVPKDAHLRITKALSRTGLYKGGRGAGWSRKDNAWPVSTGIKQQNALGLGESAGAESQ